MWAIAVVPVRTGKGFEETLMREHGPRKGERRQDDSVTFSCHSNQ